MNWAINLEINSCSLIILNTNTKLHITGNFLPRSVGPMARSYYSMLRHKLGIIYIALSHIYLVQTLKILTPKICLTISTYELSVIYLYLDIKDCNKVYDSICTYTLTSIYISHEREVFHEEVIFFTQVCTLCN